MRVGNGFATLLGAVLLGTILACSDASSLGESTTTTSVGAGGDFTRGGDGGAGGTRSSTGAGGLGGDGAGGKVVPLAGFGEISGDCGVLDEPQLAGDESDHFSNVLDFNAQVFGYRELSDGGKQIHDAGNLGGSSLYSEIFAYEVLYRCELAGLVKTESEIAYQDEAGKKTDLLVNIDGLRIGVSVTRAVGFPKDDPYTAEQAKLLLGDKLSDVLLSSSNVAVDDDWEKQVLLILAYSDEHALALEQALAEVDVATKADTIVWVTVTNGDDAFIY